MSAQHSGQNNKGPRGQVDSFLVVNCTFSHLLLIKKCKWWLCKHWLQYLKPEKEKASPGSLLLLISLLLVCPCLSSPGVRNSLAALSYRCSCANPRLPHQDSWKQTEREKLLGGRKSLACHESPGPDENSGEKGLRGSGMPVLTLTIPTLLNLPRSIWTLTWDRHLLFKKWHLSVKRIMNDLKINFSIWTIVLHSN